MSRAIYKWAFSYDDSKPEGGIPLELPAGKVVLVAAQNPADMLPTLWIEYDASDPITTYRVIGTGHPIPKQHMHVGSAVCAGGSLVWHVYRLMNERDLAAAVA